MKVLLIGSGAREHTLAWKLRQSTFLTDLFVAPGNPGIMLDNLGNLLPLSIPQPGATEYQIDLFSRQVLRLAEQVRTQLVIIGPEAPLAFGLVDALAEHGIAAIGPTQAAAEIESSKRFGKKVCELGGIPHPSYGEFDDFNRAKTFILRSGKTLFVLKEDGLASGKGVKIANSQEEAIEHLRELQLSGCFTSERRLLIEEFLVGQEVSAHAFTDGRTVAHMLFSRDHKRLLDGDLGPMTGGMGAYASVPWLSPEFAQQIRAGVTEAALRTMEELGRPYRGVLYPGLMVTHDGPMVLEFNCRLGDPEAQVLLPLLKTDLLEIFCAIRDQKLNEIKVEWEEDKFVVGVVLTSEGYPNQPITGREITGLKNLDPDVLVFHGGTKLMDGSLYTNGGRVLTIVATGRTLEEARDKVYRNVDHVYFKGRIIRSDIGLLEAA